MTTHMLDASDVIVTGRRPDRMFRVAVEGGRVVAYVHGDGHRETILCLSGDPGVSSQYMRDAFYVLADRGYRVIVHDQLGTGASDRPDDASHWTLRRYVAEVEAVRRPWGWYGPSAWT